MISVSDLQVRFGTHTVLNLSNLQVKPRTHGLILGPSGSGKTSLLHVIAGLLSAASGSVVVDQVNIANLSGSQRDSFRRGRIGFIFQRLHLIDALSIEENLLLAQRLAAKPLDRAIVSDLLARLGLAKFAARFPNQLSLGQAQRAAIARALVIQPKIILADEPTAALDDHNALAFIELLLEMAAGCTLLVATHDTRIKRRIDTVLELHSSGALQ